MAETYFERYLRLNGKTMAFLAESLRLSLECEINKFERECAGAVDEMSERVLCAVRILEKHENKNNKTIRKALAVLRGEKEFPQ